MVKAEYEVVLVLPAKVFIKDMDKGRMSITNDAEAVTLDVAIEWPGRRIIYRDTQGQWDEILHVNGAFFGFIPYSEELPKD